MYDIYKILWTFFKIGAFTFGGGYAMLPLVESEVVAHGWMSEQDIINFIAVSESTPGSFAVNVATYVGERSPVLQVLCVQHWRCTAVIYNNTHNSWLL